MAHGRGKTGLFLAGDIGGTKTRMGLFTAGKTRPVQKSEGIFPSKSYPDLASIVEEFLAGEKSAVAGACFGVAGPVTEGRSRTTNLPWTVSETRLLRRFGWPRVRLVNDLVATALAVDLLRSKETETILPGRRGASGNRVLVAPGTGLGQALMVRLDGETVPLASEGGHVDFAPLCEEQIELWRYLHHRYGHVSIERVVSGPGLVDIYRWLKSAGRYREPRWLARKMEETDPAEAVSAAAMERNTPIAAAALSRFVSVLGAVCGNLVLTALATGGVVLGGGIPPRILPFLYRGEFSEAFLGKGRFRGLLEAVPVRVILNDRAALIGAARCAVEGRRSAPGAAV
jgi:glucokinase